LLASDVTHYYEHMDSGRPFTTTFNVGDTLEGYERLRALAPSPDHIVPGHDPLVMQIYPPAKPELKDIAVRLDVQPGKRLP
jgi:glyoxylase-like metal-dependent hydrolase (beta-lactamase superfamily II)